MTFRVNLGVKEIDLVEFVHLLQEDEGENCVWPETSVIRSKTLPQTEESFLPYDLHQYILKKKEKERVKKNEREGGCAKDTFYIIYIYMLSTMNMSRGFIDTIKAAI